MRNEIVFGILVENIDEFIGRHGGFVLNVLTQSIELHSNISKKSIDVFGLRAVVLTGAQATLEYHDGLVFFEGVLCSFQDVEFGSFDVDFDEIHTLRRIDEVIETAHGNFNLLYFRVLYFVLPPFQPAVCGGVFHELKSGPTVSVSEGMIKYFYPPLSIYLTFRLLNIHGIGSKTRW